MASRLLLFPQTLDPLVLPVPLRVNALCRLCRSVKWPFLWGTRRQHFVYAGLFSESSATGPIYSKALVLYHILFILDTETSSHLGRPCTMKVRLHSRHWRAHQYLLFSQALTDAAPKKPKRSQTLAVRTCPSWSQDLVVIGSN